jgi:hypothetical protein
MGAVVNKYLSDSDELIKALSVCDRNEHFLYNIIKSGIGLNGSENNITEGGDMYYRPHHGLHLGLLRNGHTERIEMMPEYVNSFVMRNLLKTAPLPELAKFIET